MSARIRGSLSARHLAPSPCRRDLDQARSRRPHMPAPDAAHPCCAGLQTRPRPRKRGSGAWPAGSECAGRTPRQGPAGDSRGTCSDRRLLGPRSGHAGGAKRTPSPRCAARHVPIGPAMPLHATGTPSIRCTTSHSPPPLPPFPPCSFPPGEAWWPPGRGSRGSAGPPPQRLPGGRGARGGLPSG